MRPIACLALAASLVAPALAAATPTGDPPAAAPAKDRSFYSFSTKTLEGKDLALEEYKGKVALVVNVASQCGYTPQYEGLEKLYGELKDKGLVVLGFPCNDFGGQEPGSPSDIRSFCTSKYHVTFPLFAKLQTKAGDGQSELYAYLSAKTGSLPSWNFGKYLIGRDGQPIAYFSSKVTPDSKELRQAIEKALAAEAPEAAPKAAPKAAAAPGAPGGQR